MRFVVNRRTDFLYVMRLKKMQLSHSNPTGEGGGGLTAPGNGEHGYTIVAIDTTDFQDGGTLDVDIAVGQGESNASFDLFPPGAAQTPEGSVSGAYDIPAGSSCNLSASFSKGKVFQLGAEGNWFSRKGATNTFTFRAKVRAAHSAPESGEVTYDDRVLKALNRLKELGIDTIPFEHFFATLMRRINLLEPPQQQPEGFSGFLQSIGFLAPPPTDEAELQRWREGIKVKLENYWLRLLESEDPDKIKEGLEKWMRILSKYDEGLRESVQASLDSIVAWQKLVEDIGSGVPLLGTALDLIAAGSGESLSGEVVGPIRRLLHVLGAFAPAIIGKIMKRLKGASIKVLEELGELLETKEGRKEFAKALGLAEEEVEKVIEALNHIGAGPKGQRVEEILLKYYSKVDLNKAFRANFRVVDGLSREGREVISGFWKSKYVSIADSGRPYQLYIKFKALLGIGSESTYKTMLTDLAAFEGRAAGTALTAEEFLKKAAICVPDEHVMAVRELIKSRFSAGWPNPETYKIILKLNGGNKKAALDYMLKMVQPFSELMK